MLHEPWTRRTVRTVLLLLTVTACAAPAPPPQPAATTAANTAGQKAELSMLTWNYTGTMKDAYDGYISGFLPREPRVSAVNIEAQPFVNFGDVLNVRLSAKTPPNISWINASTGPQYVKSGKLVDLTPAIESMSDFDLADYPDASLAPWRNGDKLVALPFTNASNVVFYNADIFAQAGIPTPLELANQGKWTWDSMRDTSRQLVSKQAAKYGLLLNNNIFTNGFRNLIDIYAPYGAAPWSDDGQTCTINSPQAVQATQFVWDMIYTDKSLPGPGVQADWTAGNIGMVLGRANAFNNLGELPFKWEIVSVPDGPNGFIPERAQNGIGVWADAPNSDLAAEFVLYTLTKDNSMKFAANTPSPRKSLANLDAIQPANKVLTGDQLNRSVIKALDAQNFKLEYSHANYAAVEKQINQDFDARIWNETAQIPSALNQVCSDVAPLLKQ
ncbi:MAG: extracellular solute-binding protein [Chloroflexi bacterium]|nr:extracellular solute-binding protein [Chloroflexota bacterium]